MVAMSSPSRAVPNARRVVLVPAGASLARDDELVRRYRLARLRLAGREAQTAERRLPAGNGDR